MSIELLPEFTVSCKKEHTLHPFPNSRHSFRLQPAAPLPTDRTSSWRATPRESHRPATIYPRGVFKGSGVTSGDTAVVKGARMVWRGLVVIVRV